MLNSSGHLLTILVPTFNRAKNLRELLPILLPVVERMPEVDLIISNNGSSDGTSQLLRDIESRDRVQVIEQPINYGMHIHLAWLYGQAKGKFLWMVGDDDLIKPELVERVCQKLREDPELGWIHLPHCFPQAHGGPVYSLKPEHDERYTRGREIFAPYISWLTFITANIMRSELIQRNLRRLSFDNYFWPATLLVMSVADSPACVLSECKIEAGPDITWGDVFNEVTDFQLPEVILDSPVLTAVEKRSCLIQRYNSSPDHLDRLILKNRSLLLRILCAAPSLLNAKMLMRVSRKTRNFLPFGLNPND